jgi:hypothetical protein
MFLSIAAFVLALATLGLAQDQKLKYLRPPQDAPAPKLNKDARHPPPEPNSAPKSPAGKIVNRGPLPKQIPAGMYKPEFPF